MNIRFASLSVLTLFIAGCAATAINQAPVTYTATKNLQAKGSSTLTVRTYSTAPGKGRVELSGVPCQFNGQGFYSKFTTPAVVMTPDLGPRTSAASVTCNYDDQEKTIVAFAVNKTTTDIDRRVQQSTSGAGLVGLIVGSIASTSQKNRRDTSLDVYGYLDKSVTFKVDG
jgi:hypothetical protein